MYKYLKDMGSDLLKGVVIIGIVSVVCNCFPTFNPILEMICKGLVSVIISGILIIIFSIKNEYFKDTLLVLKNVLKR